MEPVLHKDKRTSCRIPIEYSVRCAVRDQILPMWTQNISLEGMFLFSQEYVKLRSVFEAGIWIDDHQEPLRCFLTACFVERSASGYGIGAQISAISSDDRARWETAYRRALAKHGRKLREESQSIERSTRDRKVLVLDEALPHTALQAMRRHGFHVDVGWYSSHLIDQMQHTPFDLVIADCSDAQMSVLPLCQEIRQAQLPTQTVLVTANATPGDFLIGLHAGAAQVIAKPCSHELLVTSLTQTLCRSREECHELVSEEERAFEQEMQMRNARTVIIDEPAALQKRPSAAAKSTVSDDGIIGFLSPLWRSFTRLARTSLRPA